MAHNAGGIYHQHNLHVGHDAAHVTQGQYRPLRGETHEKCFAPVLCLTSVLCGCGKEEIEAVKLSFAEYADIDTLNSLDGSCVTITGYMATLSPLDGRYMYLMNMPYQSCPFCVPNTCRLSNTMAVFAAGDTKFEFTDRQMKITGALKVE